MELVELDLIIWSVVTYHEFARSISFLKFLEVK